MKSAIQHAMQFNMAGPLVLALATTVVGAARPILEGRAQPVHANRLMNAGFHATQNLRFHLQEKAKAEEASIKKIEAHAGSTRKADGEHLQKLFSNVNSTKPAWAIPEDPTQDRLNHESCKEPKPYVKTDYAGAFGPEKIFCCHTVKQVIQDVKYRCEVECTDAHPCHRSMKDVYCPKYLKAYQKLEAVLCRERPTTTTTTTTVSTTTTTIPFCLEGEVSPVYPCRCGDDLCEEGEICEDGVCIKPHGDDSATDEEKDPLAWCYEVCETEMETHLGGIECETVELDVEGKTAKGCMATCQKLHSMGALRDEDNFKPP